ncbi:M48 family metallopeptidase [Desulfuromonas carbonis]|uniref:M48 family metallopeptidase n=1 Tax=Desulfuromonas sp. DDH964 TaxID=1823759 RepID=UPI00078B43B2|nr:M48 family metallopeptidase [Desulfuromonas sp. DDH964]AMV71839.1 peptidase lipoprotein, M48 family [Desulfuromonas sp. DDH964]
MSRIFLSGLAVLLLLAGGCAVNPVTGRSELALMQVSDQEEIALGEKAFPQATQTMGGEVNDPQLQAYVNRVGLSVARVSQRPGLPYSFTVVNDSSPNAFALPGGKIAITRGLLVNMDNEAQLAAILGHEVGHVNARDSVQGMQRGMLLNLGLGLLSGATDQSGYGPLAQQAGSLAAGLLDKSYSRDQERAADTLGIDYMVKAGYNPVGAVQVQDFFYRKLEGGGEPQWLSGLFRTHPFSKERLIANQQYIATTYPTPGRNARIASESFQQAIAGLKKSQEGYALYDQAREQQAQGQTGKAIATYLQAAAKAPDEALILTGLGMAYLDADDLNSARMNLARAVRLDGNYYYSRLGLGYTYLQLKQVSQALPELEQSLKLMPSLQGAYLLAEGYDQSGQAQKALALYQEVAKADPQGKLGQAVATRVTALQGKP